MKVFEKIQGVESITVLQPGSVPVATVGDAKWQHIECAPSTVHIVTLAPKPEIRFLDYLIWAPLETGFPNT